MELYHLKTFVTVADEEHLTRAADRLNTSQPAVSAHIKTLEEDLGVSLFHRTPKGMRLTREGTVLKRQAEKALSSIDEIRHRAGALKNVISGTVKLGLNIDPKYLRIDRFLSFMLKSYGKIDFQILQRWSWEQPEDLKKGELDAGFIYGIPSSPGITAISLRKFNIVIAGPIQWKNKLKKAGWKEMAAMPWVWHPPNCSFCHIGSKVFEAKGLKPIKVTIADQEPVVNALVSSGIGLAFMIEDEAREAEEEGRIAIWDTVVDTMDLSFVYMGKRKNEPLVNAVIEGIQKVWEK